jgi:hypothetical protein
MLKYCGVSMVFVLNIEGLRRYLGGIGMTIVA